MPSTYTVNLGIEKPATGEQSGTWGDTTNVNFDILDQAINGAERVTLTSAGSSGSPNTLQISNGATSDGRNKWIEFYSSGDLGGDVFVQLDPNDAEKIVFVRNSLASSRSILLFQGTYNSGRDLEIPAGVDMVVKFDGGGASAATVTDVYTKLRATEITTPTLTAGTADINGGTIDNSVIGGSTAAAVTGTTVVANTSLNIAGDGATVTGIKDEDNMASNSATKLATQQSIKAYVDSQVGTVDTWAEVLANGATSGSTNPEVTAGQALKTNTINETSAGSGVTIDSVLLKDDVVNATDVETGSISANDGTASATIANSTGVMTIASSVLTTADINAGTIDNSTIGGTTPAVGTFTQVNVDNITIDGNEIDVSSGNLTLDVAGDIILDADGGDLSVKDAGTEFGRISNSASSLQIYAPVQDKDINLLGNDGGTTITALTLDMSDAGAAYFNSGIHIPDFIYHAGDTHTYFGFQGGDQFELDTGGANRMRVVGSEVAFNDDGGDKDFRVESDGNTHALFVNGGTSNVLIGTSTVAYAGTLLNIGTTSDSQNGIQIQTTTDGNGYVLFGDGSGADAYQGQIQYEHSADRLTLRSGGGIRAQFSLGETVFNEGSADTDFRVESDSNANMLFVDAGNDAVGIGTSTPGSYYSGAEQLVVAKASGEAGITIATASDTNGALYFADGTAGAQAYQGGIGYQHDTSKLFLVESGVATMFFGPTEYVFNETSLDRDFRVESDGNANMLWVDGSRNGIGVGTSSVFEHQQGAAIDMSYDGAIWAGNTYWAGGLKTGVTFYTTTAGDKFKHSSRQAAQIYHNSQGGSIHFYSAAGGTAGDVISWQELAEFDRDEVIFNNNSHNQDFRVESDSNTNMLHVDGGNNGVGIGTTGTTTPLTVNGGTATAATIQLGNHGDNAAIHAKYNLAFKADSTEAIADRSIAFSIGTHSAFYSNVAGTVFNDGAASADFRVESDNNASMLTVDGSADLVTISGGAKVTNEILRVNGAQVVGSGAAGLYAVGLNQIFAASAAKYLRIQQDGSVFGGLTITATGDYSNVNAIGCFTKIYSIGANGSNTTLFGAGNITVADLGSTSGQFSMGTPTKPNGTTIYIPLVNLNSDYILNMSLTVEFRGRIDGISAIDIIAQ